MSLDPRPDRRTACRVLAAGAAGLLLPRRPAIARPPEGEGTGDGADEDAGATPASPGSGSDAGFRLRWMAASCLWGGAGLETVLREARRAGATAVDIWASHAKPVPQRTMVDRLGPDAFAELLERHGLELGALTHYGRDATRLQDEMRFAARFGGAVIVTGSGGPHGLKGARLRDAVRDFAERLRPHVEAAEETGCTLAIENHGRSLIETPESIRRLLDAVSSRALGIAFAPYHLPQDEEAMAELLAGIGDRVALFYAWQYGKGCMKKLPKEEELLQLPGRGPLDFAPLLAALRRAGFRGWTEIFMHPVPRGIPILEPLERVAGELVRARRHLEGRLAGTSGEARDAKAGGGAGKPPDRGR